MLLSSSKEPLHVAHVPYFESNHYQIELGNRLAERGYKVIPSGYSKKLARGLDLIHIHWLPEVAFDRNHLLRVKNFIRALRKARKLGLPAVWTIHNLYEHESRYRFLDRLVSRMVIRMAKDFHVHSERARERVIEEYSTIPPESIRVIEHPNYLGCYPDGISMADARQRLSIPDNHTCYLFFGNIRQYKGVEELVNSFNQANIPNATLLIAGRPRTHADFEFIEATRISSPNIKVFPMFIPDEDLQIYFAAADVAVLPYREILTSGAALLAMSFSKACIAPNIQTFTGVFAEDAAFYYDPDDPSGLEQSLIDAQKHKQKLPEMGAKQKLKAQYFSWDRFADQIAAMYDAALVRKEQAVVAGAR